ncbi:unnamed protein product [Phytophthora lilii]|uniref:Unnamed protein product n=1 Tax=Phytophthora lilii TaxID=2077276 RepID=A0A9W6WPX5_9STRA|nr:unnamed protein product [Phytophthora lilii]
MSWSLVELQQFDRLRFRGDVGDSQINNRSGTATPRPPSASGRTPRPAVARTSTVAGDVWRVNFSRVQYELETVVNPDTHQLQYQKVPEKREDNIVWASTGVIDIHRPERWGYVFFSSENELPGGELELASAMTGFLEERMAIGRILDAIYYRQRAFHAFHGGFASTMEMLYTDLSQNAPDSSQPSNDDTLAWMEAFPMCELLRRYELDSPEIISQSDLADDNPLDKLSNILGPQLSGEGTVSSEGGHRKTSRRYAPALDQHDEEFDSDFNALVIDGADRIAPPPPPLSPRSQKIKNLESRGLFSNFTATVRSATQEWNMTHDGRLWQTA